MIKFWNPVKQYEKHEAEIDAAIKKVLKSGKLILGAGEEIPKFEESFAKFIGVKHAIMTGGGTHALYLAYRALLKHGDEVIVPSHTFIATIDQVVAVGATPILVDVGEDGLIDPLEVKKAITLRTKAIVPVHLEGKVCDMDTLSRLAYMTGDKATRGEIYVIEDAAQAIGAGVKSDNDIFRKVGSLGHVGCFSLFPAKILGSLGNAGMLTTNDDELALRFKMLRCNSNIGKNGYLGAELGMQMEPDEIQAAVLNVRFKYLEENLKRRSEIASRYDQAFEDLPIKLPFKQEGRVYQDYVLRIPENKKEFCEFLDLNEVGHIGHQLIPNHHYSVLKDWRDKLPKTDEYISQQVRIPCNDVLEDSEVEHIIKTIKRFYGQ